MSDTVLTTESDEVIRQLSFHVRKLIAAKANEDAVTKQRIEIEQEILKLVDCPERGQKTVALPGNFKVTVERSFSYKADFDALRVLGSEQNPAPIKTKTTTVLDATEYEAYKRNNPKFFEIISQCVTVTPLKPSVSITYPK
jgi:plasmid stabilization system protein ParE